MKKVGIDILEIDRVKETKTFMTKVFTQTELDYINKFYAKKERIAGHFCAKEAVLKAIDYISTNYQEIEIIHSHNGRPLVNFYGETKKYYAKNYTDIDISISHSKTIATAICIVESKPKIIYG